ncbi:MAG TPA: Glu/Leu/Phe/Val dehydrogenase dimerization domain-containing protein [Candidatus Paceibacterota bacterium]|nr:Glu/Leu/Phe/Val dehydrogenase dimerization domain-containing protein [Candidatus Paceibacterota bacterium]
MTIEHIRIRTKEIGAKKRVKVWNRTLTLDLAKVRTHDELNFFFDPATGMRLVIAIYNTHYPQALGGMRMHVYPDRMGPVTDVLRLSEGMWHKALMAEVEFDGAKSVINNDPFTEKSPALLAAVGDCIEMLAGRYVGGEDLHMYQKDCLAVAERTTHVGGTTSGGADLVSPDTAYGVVQAILATSEFLREGRQLGDMSFAVQGAGKVGYHVIERLVLHGARVYVSEVADANNWSKAERVAREFGAIPVRDLDEFYRLPVDGFVPCAVGGILNDKTIDLLRAKFVVGSANNQLLAPEHGALLHRKGILYGIDFVANAGGLIHLAHEKDESSEVEVREHIARITHGKMLAIYEHAASNNIPTTVAATRFLAKREIELRQPKKRLK